MTTLNFTKNEIITMVTKGTNRTLNSSEAAKMLNDLKGLNESEANIYLSLWSTKSWFNRINTNKGINCMYIFQSVKQNKNAYIEFLLSDVKNA